MYIFTMMPTNRKEASEIENVKREDCRNFLKLRDKYYNESLEEFVTNKNETTKTIEL